MNAKRKWDTRTILLVLIIALIIIAVVFVIFIQPGGENNSQTVLTVEEIVQNRDNYVGKKVIVEGFYHISIDSQPSLIPATTVSDPNPTIWVNLNETSLNLAKQKAGNLTVSSNLKYRVAGVLEKISYPVGFDVMIKVESIEAV